MKENKFMKQNENCSLDDKGNCSTHQINHSTGQDWLIFKENKSTIEEIVEDFNKSLPSIFVGFTHRGEYNQYLNEIDEEALNWIRGFIRKSISQTEERVREEVVNECLKIVFGGVKNEDGSLSPNNLTDEEKLNRIISLKKRR